MRPLLASAALAAALALAGCNTDGTPDVGGRHLQPLSERLTADIEAKNMAAESPILVRLFKEEAELEVWKEDKTGKFALLRTYPICRWSGDLGPKIKQGDRQAPEGFYTITPGLMNPNSNYYLAINTGFPNAYDRANGRTGDFLMIHGDCSSRGCYAMTDEQIAEIYSLARESFFGGQKSFQIQAFPFRMTPLNMARHRNAPHMAFWKMIKEGYDSFEITRREPKVDVCERKYVFNAESSTKFSAADHCPAYRVPQDLASQLRARQQQDEAQTAELISRGTPVAPSRTGVDGGMNPTFLAAVKSHGGPGALIKTASGTIPAHVNPPAEPSRETTGSFGFGLASADSRPASVQVASAGSSGGGIGGFLSNLFGSKEEEPATKPATDTAKTKPAAKAAAKPKTEPKTALAETRTVDAKPAATPASGKPVQAASAAPTWPQPPATKPAEEPQSKTAEAGGGNNLLSGAAPTVPSGGFENRFGAWR
jgi:murein L,D-transpeptidase YafK